MNENKKYADYLWSLLVKARADFQSEISGKTERLHSHHLRGKSNYALRYSLDNGICITAGEHFFGFHRADRRENYEEKVKILRGKDIFEKLENLKQKDSESIINIIEKLESELKNYADKLEYHVKPSKYFTRLKKTF